MAACTTSTNAATSWSVIRSRSPTAATNASSTDRCAFAGRRRHRRPARPRAAAWASVASSSISSHRAEPGRVGPHLGHLRERVAGITGSLTARSGSRRARRRRRRPAPGRRPAASTSSISCRAPAGRRGGSRTSPSVGAPPRQRLVHRLDTGEDVDAVRVGRQRRAVDPVVGAHLDGVEPVEHVELGDGQLGQAVEPHGVAQHHAVEPAGPAATAGDRAELAADLDEPVAVGIGELGRERPGPDPGRVGLGDPDDAVDVARAEAGAGARAAGGRVRRRDVRVGAVVEVEERGLGALEQQVGARRRGRRGAG